MNILKLYKILNEGSPSIFAEEEMVDEMAMIVGNLDTAIRDVVDANPNLQGNELKRVVRGDADVRNALAGDKLHDNQLNRFIDKIRSGKSPRPEPGAEPAPGAEPTHGAHDSPLPSQASKIAPQVRMAILSKLDHGATPEELADRYGLEVDDITAMQSMSAAEDEGDVKDIEAFRTEPSDREHKHIEIPTPEQSSRTVDAEVLAKAERAFYINPKADKEQVMNNLKVWAAKRNDRTDITQTKHPLRGASDEQVTDALNKVAKKLGAQKVAAGKRLGSQSLGGNELGDDSGAKEYKDLDRDFAHEESFASFSNTLSEHMKTLKSTSTVRYPNQVKFSEEFINKLVEEYTNHTAIREGQGVIRNIEEKMLKALRMHLHEISKAKKLNEEPQFSKGKLPSDEYTSKDKLKEPKKDPKYDFKNRPGTYGYDRTKPIEERINASNPLFKQYQDLCTKIRYARKTNDKSLLKNYQSQLQRMALNSPEGLDSWVSDSDYMAATTN